MCARAHPPVDCRPRRRITQRGVLPADDNPVRKLYNKAWADFASHLPMCWMQTVCAKDAATNVRPPALRALVCVALCLGARRACGTALSAARPVPPQKLAVRGFFTGGGYAPFVEAAKLAVKVSENARPLCLIATG